MDAWFPEEYCDEVMPADRESANAWLLKMADGSICLDACEMGDDPRPLADGEIVKFSTRTDYGQTTLHLFGDGSFSIDDAMPEKAEQCCVMHGWQTETLSTDVNELVSQLKDAGGDPDDYNVSFYTFSDSIPLRFDAKSAAFVQPGPTQ